MWVCERTLECVTSDPVFSWVYVQVEEELWEEDFIEHCFQEMLEEEQWEWFIPSRDLPSLQEQITLLVLEDADADFDIVVSLACEYRQSG